MFAKLKDISWLTVGASAVAIIIIGLLVLMVFINPMKNSYLETYSNKEKNIRSEIGTLRGYVTKTKASVDQTLEEKFGDAVTYQVAYGLATNETKSDIPAYFRSLELHTYVDSNGIVIKTDTVGRWEMFVPPVANWRNWKNVKKNLGYIPTQVVSFDTTYSFSDKEKEKRTFM